jgi:hypothetical protein
MLSPMRDTPRHYAREPIAFHAASQLNAPV